MPRDRWEKVRGVAELLHEQATRLNAELGFLSPELTEGLLMTAGILLEVTEPAISPFRESAPTLQ